MVNPTNSDKYVTDKWLKTIFTGWFDPCPINPEPFTDGLGSSWGDKTFVNPPYSNPLPWVRKGIKEAAKGKKIVFLLKHDSSTRWYAELKAAGARFLMVEGRLKHETGKSANFPSVLAVLN
jgi:hypothetical protein